MMAGSYSLFVFSKVSSFKWLLVACCGGVLLLCSFHSAVPSAPVSAVCVPTVSDSEGIWDLESEENCASVFLMLLSNFDCYEISHSRAFSSSAILDINYGTVRR